MGNSQPKFNQNDFKDRIIVFIKNDVYDITDFLDKHPGGKECFYKFNLKDVSETYEFHSKIAKKIWKNYYVGKI